MLLPLLINVPLSDSELFFCFIVREISYNVTISLLLYNRYKCGTAERLKCVGRNCKDRSLCLEN
jgi:hypothetical protein